MRFISSPRCTTRTHRHFRLGRGDAAPEIPEDEFKPWVQVQSKHNTPIEGFWLWLREGEGHNIRDVILRGAIDFDADDPLHV